MARAGRSLWVALHLLDRQVVDCNAIATAKIDDVAFIVPDDGGLPVLAAILTGHAALAHRFNRRWARAFEMLRRVIEPTPEPGPDAISWSYVKGIATEIDLTVSRHDLAATAADHWLTEHVLAHIPGSGINSGDEQ